MSNSFDDGKTSRRDFFVKAGLAGAALAAGAYAVKTHFDLAAIQKEQDILREYLKNGTIPSLNLSDEDEKKYLEESFKKQGLEGDELERSIKMAQTGVMVRIAPANPKKLSPVPEVYVTTLPDTKKGQDISRIVYAPDNVRVEYKNSPAKTFELKEIEPVYNDTSKYPSGRFEGKYSAARPRTCFNTNMTPGDNPPIAVEVPDGGSISLRVEGDDRYISKVKLDLGKKGEGLADISVYHAEVQVKGLNPDQLKTIDDARRVLPKDEIDFGLHIDDTILFSLLSGKGVFEGKHHNVPVDVRPASKKRADGQGAAKY